jgi:hypothetical protein
MYICIYMIVYPGRSLCDLINVYATSVVYTLDNIVHVVSIVFVTD